ncbi:MAG: NAD(P)-dependent oxidoreductase [Moorea sp. SIO2B7]|nr:NAD(P)-dependent oxidoreductase [Moorena sp. SIO2B7]
MKILVTGGTGFLGKQLVVKLRELGYELVILGRNAQIGQKLAAENVQFLARDLRDKEAIIAACQGQDYVFHCGALSSPWGKYQDFYETNVLGTCHIIQGCQIHKVKRLIYVSTSSVYFDFSHRFNIPENTPLPQPVNAYAKTKQLAEEAIKQAYQLGLPVITIRPRGIFGPGDTTILPRLIRASTNTGIPLINQGQACIDITYIDNVVNALLLCKDAPDALLGRIFNITNGETISIVNLLEKLSRKLGYPFKLKPISYNMAYWAASAMELMANTLLLGTEPILTRYTVGLLAFSQTLDITAATQELGFKPCVSLEEGLDSFAQWWQEAG